jgi:hypothetical protein
LKEKEKDCNEDYERDWPRIKEKSKDRRQIEIVRKD